MNALSRRLIASFSLLAFAVTLLAGLVFRVQADQVLIRSMTAFFVYGGATCVIALIFERLWTR